MGDDAVGPEAGEVDARVRLGDLDRDGHRRDAHGGSFLRRFASPGAPAPAAHDGATFRAGWPADLRRRAFALALYADAVAGGHR